jgi:hypothetical protein
MDEKDEDGSMVKKFVQFMDIDYRVLDIRVLAILRAAP